VTRERRLWIVLWLNVALLGLLVVTGLSAGSLGLLAAAGDYIVDVGAISLALLAIWLRNHARDGRFDRAPTLAALVNVVLLIVIIAWVMVEAVHRLVTREFELQPVPVIAAALAAAVVMALGAVILGTDQPDEDDTAADRLNMRAVLLDTIADAVSAGAVALSALIVLVTSGWQWLDPLVAIVISLVVGYHALGLLKEVREELRAAGDEHQQP
jgi:cobalt-zinc-cadmium efflux system protein